jgi:(1->4)-alpha-D-glucan 1-alpha-D-glucosylmutase
MKSMPRCSYRLQLHRSFGFGEVAALAPYLAELGVSHVYLSPIFAAVAGSQHGYDVVDHDRVNPELGGEAAHRAMCAELAKHGLEQILDIVPNHMAIGTADNRLWWDVLENGPASQYASFFDVDWQGGSDTRVLLPILGEPYVDGLAHGLVKLTRQGARFIVAYHEHLYPAAPRSLGPILRAAARDHEELGYLASAYAELPAPTSTDRENVQRRQRDKQVLDRYLERLLEGDPALSQRVDDQLAAINGNLTELDGWLERQNWRLAHWRTAATELGYRRFFDVQSLAGASSNVSTIECCGGFATARSPGCASTISMACSIRSSTCGGCATARPTRGSSWRRSRSPTRRCPTRGPWMERRATS